MNDDDNAITLTLPDTADFDISSFALDDSDSITIDTSSYNSFDLNFNYNPGIDVTQGDLTVHNEGDIKLGDRSLKEFMDKVEERMNILHVNPELEERWEALRKLGEEYKKLEKELLEKEKVWEALKYE